MENSKEVPLKFKILVLILSVLMLCNTTIKSKYKAFNIYADSPKSHSLYFVTYLRRCLELARMKSLEGGRVVWGGASLSSSSVPALGCDGCPVSFLRFQTNPGWESRTRHVPFPSPAA